VSQTCAGRRKTAATRNPRVIIFGTGQGGRLAFQRLSKLCRVIAFLDNNPDMQGRRFCRVPVLAPESVSGLRYDWICLASVYRDEMAGQLQGLGVPLHRLRDGSMAEWDESGWPPPISRWACRKTVLVGPRETCRHAAKILAGSLDIIGSHARDAGVAELTGGGAELFVIASPEPELELVRLMAAGIPLDAIEVLAPDFMAQAEKW
jgi:hypothetical protein